MNCLKEAENKLRDYNAKSHSIGVVQDEIARLESEMSCVRSATTDSTPVQGGGNCREDALLSNIAMRAELAAARDSTKTWLNTVDSALSVLSGEERHILDMFYINRRRGHVERLADELCIEQAQVYRRKNIALRHFALALYGVTET